MDIQFYAFAFDSRDGMSHNLMHTWSAMWNSSESGIG